MDIMNTENLQNYRNLDNLSGQINWTLKDKNVRSTYLQRTAQKWPFYITIFGSSVEKFCVT